MSWQMMFTRSLFRTTEMDAQHRLLSEVSALVDAGVLKSRLTRSIGCTGAEKLRAAHEAVESGRTIGKIVPQRF
jgi:NADPH:quinone reductase-like Zn-dependent oxidoreductase